MEDAQNEIDSRSVTASDLIDPIGKRAETQNADLPSDPDELYKAVAKALEKRFEQQERLDKRMGVGSRTKKFWNKWKKKRQAKKQGGQGGEQQEEGGESSSGDEAGSGSSVGEEAGSGSNAGEEEGGASQPAEDANEGQTEEAPKEPNYDEVFWDSTPEQPYQYQFKGDPDDPRVNLQIVPPKAEDVAKLEGDNAARAEAERKADPSTLRALFDTVKLKTAAGSTVGPVTLSINEEALYATTEFYGCTVIIVFNGKDFILGHYCEEVPEILDLSEKAKGKGKEGESSTDALKKILQKGAKVLSDMNAINDKITVPLANKMETLDTPAHTRIWIIHSRLYSRYSDGIRFLVEELKPMNIGNNQIGLIQYHATGSVGGTRKGPRGKCVIQWVPRGNGRSATFRLFVEHDEPIYERDFDCNGNPVGAAREIGGTVVLPPV